MPPETVQNAVDELGTTSTTLKEAAWRASFVPHAIIATERERRPSPLFVVFFIGVDRLIRINFDLGAGPETFLRQALDGVRARLAECRSAGFLDLANRRGWSSTTAPIMRSTTTSKGMLLKSSKTPVGPAWSRSRSAGDQ